MKKVVFIGGGGGVMNIAPGLRDDFDVTAIITTFDDGGSYGTFRRDYKCPLTGDIRRALAALSTNNLGELTEYRFADGELKGHTLGNILLAATFSKTGDGQKAMEKLHEIFKVKGRVLPVSYDLAELNAELKDRTILRGEHVIDEPHSKSNIGIQRVWLDPDPKPAEGVIEDIQKADLIIMGPGDIYCSLVPNLLVPGVAEAIIKSNAKKVYFCNVFTKYGQTNGFTAENHIKAFESFLKPNTFQNIVINTSKIPEEVINHHKELNEEPVKVNIETLQKQGYDVLERDLNDERIFEKSEADNLKRSKIRYAPDKIKKTVSKIISD